MAGQETGINETKLDSSVPQDLFSFEGYTWASRDRNRFGGVCGFLNEKLH